MTRPESKNGDGQQPLMRLQKFLSAAGICSRRRAEVLIREGRVQVNGVVVTEMGVKVDPDADMVMADGTSAALTSEKIYIALNKPAGYVTSCDQQGERIVLDMIDIPERIVPVGRLDKDSTGLLLLTNDGPLHNRLTHPSFDHEKEYLVTTGRPIPDGALDKLATGLPLMGRKTRPAVVRRVAPNRFRITLKEGRNRQIRRMVRKVGEDVAELQRLRIAGVRLGNLPEGKWRFLTKEEVRRLVGESSPKED